MENKLAELRNVVVRLSKDDEERIRRLAEVLAVSESKVIRVTLEFYEESMLQLARRIMNCDPDARCHEVSRVLDRIEEVGMVES